MILEERRWTVDLEWESGSNFVGPTLMLDYVEFEDFIFFFVTWVFIVSWRLLLNSLKISPLTLSFIGN